eukprot:SAG11_NODE_14702_length_602_cov_1.787276_1_plen_58_part_10
MHSSTLPHVESKYSDRIILETLANMSKPRSTSKLVRRHELRSMEGTHPVPGHTALRDF